MATADLQTFIEDRLRAAFPTVDLAPGAPAQVSFVQPLLRRLGTDPFGTDIDSFIIDRFRQEFPNEFAGDPSVIRDTFIKPLLLILEPFKREIETIKRNQSLQDPTALSDDDADALVANVFDYRTSGRFATGVARLFFQNPSSQQIEIGHTFYTANGLNFFPLNPISITAEEMVYNRQGALFFMDVPLRAEKEGTEYNIEVDDIVGVLGVYGFVKVTNHRRFSDGATKIDTPSFVAAAREALNERSLVSRRGANARIRQQFQGNIRAVQVIGAKDPEMRRDILVATGPGHAWMTGKITFYKNLAWVKCYTVDGDVSAPVPGDQVYWYDGSQKRSVIAEVLSGNFGAAGAGVIASFLVRLGTKNYDAVNEFYGGFERKGTVRISSLPSIGSVALEIPNQEVHAYGHADIYVRPVVQDSSKAVLSSLSDGEPVVQDSTLATTGLDANHKNRVSVPSAGMLANVVVGDLLTIEEGDDTGTYTILRIDGAYLWLSAALSQTATNLRFRISKSVTLDPFEPKIKKLPFGAVPANDAQTIIGSNVIHFSSTDVLNYGVKAGDTVRLLTGLDKGDYKITGFKSGMYVILNEQMKSSSAGISYEIFTALDPVVRPLVRVREIALLDSSRKSTGIVVPQADPVAIVPQSDFTTAQVRGYSQVSSGFVLPAINDGVVDYLVTRNNVAGDSGDRRYSLGIDPTEGGTYKVTVMADGSKSEILFPPDADPDCSYFLVTCEDTSKAENFPPIDPRPGDALTIKSGPNKGSYLIKQVRKFKYTTGNPATKTNWLYFVKIYGTFPVDVFRQLVTFLEANGQAVGKIPDTVAFPDFFTTTFYASLGTKMNAAIVAAGGTSPGAVALQSYLDSMLRCDYEWGDPSRGVLRSYFAQPTVFQQNTGDSAKATTYDFKADTGEVVSFRPDPTRYKTHTIVPARLDIDADPKDYPRDCKVGVAGAVSFLDPGATMLNRGVQVGDSLEIYEETFLHVDKTRETVIKTVANSTRVESPQALFADPALVGNLLVIQEGLDKGVYKVLSRSADSKYLTLDRPMRVTTPTFIEAPRSCTYGFVGGVNRVVADSLEDLSAKDWATTQKWLTLYIAKGDRAGVEAGTVNSYFCGSYKVLSVAAGGVVTVDRATPGLPNFPVVSDSAFFVVTDGPASAPKVYGQGTELVAARPVRIYSDVVSTYPVTSVNPLAGTSAITVTGTPKDGYRQPYRVYRKNIRRITSTEMSEKQDGFLCYFDTEVVSLGPSSLSNIQQNSYLTLRDDTYASVGYRHSVEDNTLSFSMKEEGTLVLPAAILPVKSPDMPDNYITLVGSPVQISYERADAVQALQEFLDSAEDRVASANMLARHFLPAYVSYDVRYAGGSSPALITKDIVDYINNLPVETPLDVSEMEKFIDQRGGNPVTPTKVSISIHDWDRRVWVEFGEDQLGGVDTKVPYNGTPRVSYFIPGVDTTSVASVTGERIKLLNS